MPALAAKLKDLAPYALIELVLPGGSLIALLLWLYRRRKSSGADLRVKRNLLGVRVRLGRRFLENPIGHPCLNNYGEKQYQS
jgi:hypothetical protein